MYLGLAEGEWKSHFYNHKLSFKHKRYSNKTMLSSYMWHLKSVSSETPNLKWSILRCVPPYSNISKKCLFRLYEKLEIITFQNRKLINIKWKLKLKLHPLRKADLWNVESANSLSVAFLLSRLLYYQDPSLIYVSMTKVSFLSIISQFSADLFF